MIAYIRSFFLAAIAPSVLSLGLAQSASADQHENKFRKSVMKAVGGTMGGLAAVLKKQASAEHAVPLAHTMYQLSKVVPHVYPEGSDFGETRALLAIWEKRVEFKAAVEAFQAAALNISKVSHSGDIAAYGAAFGQLGKSCKGCHENFRKKKDK